MPNTSFRTTAALAALLGASQAAALSATGFEHSYIEPLPVVLTMSRMPLALRDAPGAVTVIDQELIRASGYRDIGRLFRLVPGMQVGQERGNDQWVTYHGLGLDFPSQMQLLIDGRSVNTPHFDWGKLRLALEDIDRIEVVRGSDAAAYGSNAFLGVVNILTRHTRSEPGASARVTTGHRGIRDASARALLRDGPLGLRVSATQQHDHGFRGLHDGRRMNAVNLRGDLGVGPADELTVLAGVLDGRQQAGYPGIPGNEERAPGYRDGHVHLRWQRTLGPDSEISLSWYQLRESTRERWTAVLPFDPILHVPQLRIPVDNSRTNRRDNVEFQHRSAPLDGVRLLWGAEWRRDRLDWPLFFFGQDVQRRTMRRAFANLEWRMSEHWLVHGGTMAEQHSDSATRHSPRLFVTWQPDTRQSWRLGYSRAWREPSQFERRGDVRIIHPDSGTLLQQRHIANPDIRPQRIDAVEAGYFSILEAAHGTVDVRLFHERITDLVWRITVPAPPGSVQEALGAGSAQWDNLPGHVRLTGLEYQIRYTPWADGTLIVNHSLIRANASHRPLEKAVAPYTASASWLQTVGPWQSMLSVLRQGPLDAGSSDVQGYRYVVPAYTTMDWSVARELRLAGVPAELRLSALNLLGRHQELAHRPLQQRAGTTPATQVEPQFYVSLQAAF